MPNVVGKKLEGSNLQFEWILKKSCGNHYSFGRSKPSAKTIKLYKLIANI